MYSVFFPFNTFSSSGALCWWCYQNLGKITINWRDMPIKSGVNWRGNVKWFFPLIFKIWNEIWPQPEICFRGLTNGQHCKLAASGCGMKDLYLEMQHLPETNVASRNEGNGMSICQNLLHSTSHPTPLIGLSSAMSQCLLAADNAFLPPGPRVRIFHERNLGQ